MSWLTENANFSARCWRWAASLSPSQHVADAFNSLYGAGRCRIINNGIDVATEAILAELSPVNETGETENCHCRS